MANLSNLLSVSQPKGMWISIIQAFEGATKNYVLAIILLTVVIRVIWAVVETFSKYSQQKMAASQAQMQPEIEKLKAKYASQPQVLQQKQNELYKKYMGKGYYGGCIMTMVVLILNLVIFFTLFSGLNAMAGYKMASGYDKLKYDYINAISVTESYLGEDDASTPENEREIKAEIFKDNSSLEYRIVEREETDGTTKKYIQLVKKGETDAVLEEIEYKTDFAVTTPPAVEGEDEVVTPSNTVALEIIHKIFPIDAEGNYDQSKDILLSHTLRVDSEGNPVLDAEGNQLYDDVYLSSAVQSVAMNLISNTYESTKDSFLWIQNIWQPDSPTSKQIVSYGQIKSAFGKSIQEGEETIYNAFMPDLKKIKDKGNGLLLIPVLCVLFSMLSIYINSLYNKIKNKKKGLAAPKTSKVMLIIMPVILGLFALLYNSVFAIYMLTGQIVSTILSPLQLLIVDKILDKKEDKKKTEVVTVDYARKF